MNYHSFLSRSYPCSIFFKAKLASLSLGFILLCGSIEAQQCDVSSGTVATLSPTNNLCLNDGTTKPVQLTVSGNVGVGRYGLAVAVTGKVVAVNTTGLFEMTLYPPGNYHAGHVSVQHVSTFAGVGNISQLMGCYDLSNAIAISTFWVDAGTITALGATQLNGGTLEFEVSGASGPYQAWVLLNAQGTDILAVQTESTFNFDNYPHGTYRVAHSAFGEGINPNDIDPQSSGGCIDVSNVVTVVKSAETIVVEVINPATGKIWMDRNLGASAVATSPSDAVGYGDLYQWGRATDGHQIRTSPISFTISYSDQPEHGSFILSPTTPFDWRTTHNNNLWQGEDGVNNPCPDGFRIPTEVEWNEERLTWAIQNSSVTFLSPLNLPVAGSRDYFGGGLDAVGVIGNYWSSSVLDLFARRFTFFNIYIQMGHGFRSTGASVRCIKD